MPSMPSEIHVNVFARPPSTTGVILAVVCGPSGALTAVAWARHRTPSVQHCATGAGLPDLLAWVGAWWSGVGVRALLVERGAWLGALPPAALLPWLLLPTGGPQLAFPDPVRPTDPLWAEAGRRLPDGEPAAVRALAQCLVWDATV